MEALPKSWQPIVGEEIDKPYFRSLATFIDNQREVATVYPPDGDVFNALRLTPFAQVKVLLLGQDPYHGAGQAHGLAFSVGKGVTPPPSLRNIFREMHDDVGCAKPADGNLERWARQGVLLLNAVLTVRASEANSHQGEGWERFTDAIIERLDARERPVVFLLWGGYARRKKKLIDTARHVVIESAHPSPLSAKRGFFGSRPFSRTNAALKEFGEEPIAWCP